MSLKLNLGGLNKLHLPASTAKNPPQSSPPVQPPVAPQVVPPVVGAPTQVPAASKAAAILSAMNVPTGQPLPASDTPKKGGKKKDTSPSSATGVLAGMLTPKPAQEAVPFETAPQAPALSPGVSVASPQPAFDIEALAKKFSAMLLEGLKGVIPPDVTTRIVGLEKGLEKRFDAVSKDLANLANMISALSTQLSELKSASAMSYPVGVDQTAIMTEPECIPYVKDTCYGLSLNNVYIETEPEDVRLNLIKMMLDQRQYTDDPREVYDYLVRTGYDWRTPVTDPAKLVGKV